MEARFQNVEVKPNTAYIASVWVRAVDLHGKGFGKNATDSAGLILQEINHYNRILRSYPKVEVKKAEPYVLLSQRITTGPDTIKVRYSLDTILKCHYTEGHVTYDDCLLREETESAKAR